MSRPESQASYGPSALRYGPAVRRPDFDADLAGLSLPTTSLWHESWRWETGEWVPNGYLACSAPSCHGCGTYDPGYLPVTPTTPGYTPPPTFANPWVDTLVFGVTLLLVTVTTVALNTYVWHGSQMSPWAGSIGAATSLYWWRVHYRP